MTDIIHQILHT